MVFFIESAKPWTRKNIVVQTDKYFYIMELKMDANADEALRQVGEKGYAKPFAIDSRKFFKIGVGFSSQTRRNEEWRIIQRKILLKSGYRTRQKKDYRSFEYLRSLVNPNRSLDFGVNRQKRTASQSRPCCRTPRK